MTPAEVPALFQVHRDAEARPDFDTFMDDDHLATAEFGVRSRR